MNPKLFEEIQKRHRADERSRRIKQVVVFLLSNVFALFFAIYGLKCILTLQGKLPASRHDDHLFYPVTGRLAVLAGLGYLCAAIFSWLTGGAPPDEERSGWWRVGRGIIRWGSVAGLGIFWLEAYQLRAGRAGFLGKTIREGFTEDQQVFVLIASAFGMIFGIVALLCFLFAMLQREKVKADLRERGCEPLHIGWRPLAYWDINLYASTAFRVIYRDPEGLLHKAYCCVRMNNDFQRRVDWLQDEERDFIDV